MTAGGSRLSMDLLRAAVARLDRTTSPDDVVSAWSEAWSAAEDGLQRLAGTGVLTGQSLLRELRARNVISLSEAHAVVDLGALAERVAGGDQPTQEERDGARTAFAVVVGVLERRGAPQGQTSASSAEAEAAPLPSVPPVGARPRSHLKRGLAVAAVLAFMGGVAWVASRFMSEPADLRRGRAAYMAGDRLTARNAFSAASGRHPDLAEPLIYLGRISREEGDLASAREALRRAIALEPANPLGHRELAAVLLAGGRPDLARSFYERAIRLDPTDRTALGFMGCTLTQLGRPDLAQRFFARAGAGPWTVCANPAPGPAPPPAPR